MTPTLGFTGDVMLGRLVDEHQRRRPVDAVWGTVGDRLRSLDGVFVNLECCLSTRGEPWSGTYHPFHFRADPDWAVPALERVDVDWASLANNHLLDYGPDALRDTVAALDDAGIAHAGAGRDLAAARRPAHVEIDGLAVAFVSFTDNTPEFAAGPNRPGVAHVAVDPDDTAAKNVVRAALADAREHDPDLLVASMHWGPNMTTEPTGERRRFARWLLDAGVDVVHGHSAHVFHGVEVHGDGVVLYDAGDFVDDYAVDADRRNDRSFLFELAVGDDGDVRELRLRPIEIFDYAVHEAEGEVAEWCRARMRQRSAAFGTRFDRDGESLVVAL